MIAESIRRTHNGESISLLFGDWAETSGVHMIDGSWGTENVGWRFAGIAIHGVIDTESCTDFFCNFLYLCCLYYYEESSSQKKLNSDAKGRFNGLTLSDTSSLNTFCTKNHKTLGGAFAASFSWASICSTLAPNLRRWSIVRDGLAAYPSSGENGVNNPFKRKRGVWNLLSLPYWDGISSLLTGSVEVSSGKGWPSHAARLSWSLVISEH